MNLLSARWWLHFAHAVTMLVLLATGLLIEFPEARARVLGGYGRELLQIHDWTGVVFAIAPLLALFLAGRPLLADVRKRLVAPRIARWARPQVWRASHVAASLLLSVLLVATGFLLWLDLGLPIAALDAMLTIHITATWLLFGLLPIHIVAARHRIAAALGRLVRGGAPPRLDLSLEEEERERA